MLQGTQQKKQNSKKEQWFIFKKYIIQGIKFFFNTSSIALKNFGYYCQEDYVTLGPAKSSRLINLPFIFCFRIYRQAVYFFFQQTVIQLALANTMERNFRGAKGFGVRSSKEGYYWSTVFGHLVSIHVGWTQKFVVFIWFTGTLTIPITFYSYSDVIIAQEFLLGTSDHDLYLHKYLSLLIFDLFCLFLVLFLFSWCIFKHYSMSDYRFISSNKSRFRQFNFFTAYFNKIVIFCTCVIFSVSFILYSECLVPLLISQGLLSQDFFGLVARGLIFGLGFVYLYFSRNYHTLVNLQQFELFSIKFLVLVGFDILLNNYNFLSFYLAFELVSFSLYILASCVGAQFKSSEAALKYFLLGTVSSGFLLMGIAVIYWSCGSVNFFQIKNILSLSYSFYYDFFLLQDCWETHVNFPRGVLLGAYLIIIAFLFKLAAAPLHMWSVDVYEGVLLSVSGLFSTLVKLGMFLIFFRLIFYVFYDLLWFLQPCLFLFGIGSLIIGCFGALYQKKLISFLVYSSINNVGFLLLSAGLGSFDDIRNCFIYLVFYVVAVLSVFGILTLFCFNTGRSFVFLSDFQFLSKKYPLASFLITLSLLSLAGIPPFAGFFAKFFILYSICSQKSYILYLLVIFLSVVSTFYYLKIVKIFFFDEPRLYFRNKYPFYLVRRCQMPTILFILGGSLILMYFFIGFFYSIITNWSLSLVHPHLYSFL